MGTLIERFRKLAPKAALWLLLGLAALVATAPASVAGRLLAGTRFCLTGSRGSLWSGSAWLAGRGADGVVKPIVPLLWSLAWHGGPAVDVVSSGGAGVVQFGLTGAHLTMPAFDVDLSALPLPPALAASRPAGHLRGIDGRFALGHGLTVKGSVKLRIEDMRLGLFPDDRFGDVDVSVDADDREWSARLVADGRAALSGLATVSARSDRLSMVCDLRATRRASAELSRAVASPSIACDAMSQ